MALGFTDHDRGLVFDGTEFEPESGFAASEIRAGSDLAVDAQDATGVLTSDRITETDIPELFPIKLTHILRAGDSAHIPSG